MTESHMSVVRALTEDEADLFDVGPMYKVKTATGDLIDVFGDEIYEYEEVEEGV